MNSSQDVENSSASLPNRMIHWVKSQAFFANKMIVLLTVWRPRRKDIPALLSIVVLPLLIALPQFFGMFHDDPRIYVGDLAQNIRSGWIGGVPHIDPNVGFTTQALGRLVGIDWLHGLIPWWNPYSGVGLPLAAEYQPGVFFPLTLALLLPDGMIWRHLLLQVLAGWGCYSLIRQLGCGRLAALTAGLLFAQNGTLSWLADAPSAPAAFFPWVLLGIERAVAQAVHLEPFGWRLLALALAMMLLAGFPETAYICGLFALAWSMLRWVQCSTDRRFGVAWRLLLGCGVGLVGCGVGLALAAPQILVFLEFLPSAFTGHADFSHAALVPRASIPSLIAPYVFGPIFAYGQWPPLSAVWGGVGGYVDIVELVLAAYGLWHKRGWLSWMLCGWIVLAVAKTFGIQPLANWWNLVPGISSTAFPRYSTPTWELATTVLVGFGVDALSGHNVQRRGPVLAAGFVSALGIIFLLAYAVRLWPHEPIAGLHKWMLVSVVWALFTSALAVSLLVWFPCRWRARAIAALLVLDASTLFALPTLSNPCSGTIDTAAIGFLHRNLGLERFYTLGPIAPNYGAYFEISSINNNYIPVARRWVNWVSANLDSASVPAIFTGNYHPDQNGPSATQELRRNLAAYEEAGVKYVVAPAGQNPFVEVISPPTLDYGNRPLSLASGQSIHGVIPPSVFLNPVRINGVGVLIGNYNNTADGTLSVTLCVSGKCVSGGADLASSQDNAIFWVPLTQPLILAANSGVTYTILHQGGTKPVALWAYPTDVNQSLIAPNGAEAGFGLKLQLRQMQSSDIPQQAYADGLMDIYQLPSPSPYFEVLRGSCALQPQSRTSVVADCSTAAKLVRRELFFPGWQARIDGQLIPIVDHDGLFQLVNLPAGHRTITYHYAPPHIFWAWLLMGLAVAMLTVPLFIRTEKDQRVARVPPQ